MIDKSLRQGILNKANIRSIALLENFLRGFGFKKVQVQTAG